MRPTQCWARAGQTRLDASTGGRVGRVPHLISPSVRVLRRVEYCADAVLVVPDAQGSYQGH